MYDFVKHIDIVVEDDSFENCRLSISTNENHLNRHRMLHGGVLFTLADTAAGSTAVHDGKYVTMNSSFNFLKSVNSGKIVATTEVLNKSNKTMVIKVDVTCEDLLLATGIFTMYKIQ